MPGQAATDSYRQMVATRERPDIALQAAHELHLDYVRARGNEIAKSSLQIGGRQGTSGRKERVPRAGCQDQKICVLHYIFGGEGWRLSRNVNRADARVNDAASGVCRALEQKSIQNGARIDDDGMVEA